MDVVEVLGIVVVVLGIVVVVVDDIGVVVVVVVGADVVVGVEVVLAACAVVVGEGSVDVVVTDLETVEDVNWVVVVSAGPGNVTAVVLGCDVATPDPNVGGSKSAVTKGASPTGAVVEVSTTAAKSSPPMSSRSTPLASTSGCGEVVLSTSQSAPATMPSVRTAAVMRRIPPEMSRPTSTLSRNEERVSAGLDSARRLAICLARSSGLERCGPLTGNRKSLSSCCPLDGSYDSRRPMSTTVMVGRLRVIASIFGRSPRCLGFALATLASSYGRHANRRRSADSCSDGRATSGDCLREGEVDDQPGVTTMPHRTR